MRTLFGLAAAALLTLPALPAQEKPELPIYKVEFNIRDSRGGKPLHYSLRLEPSRKAVLRVGNRVPVATGSFQPGTAGALVSTQYTYLDIGVNIECIISEMGGRIAMHGNLDMSTITPPEPATPGGTPANPTVGQTKVELDTALDLGKPTVVAEIDDPTGTRHFQIEAIVTRAN